MRRLLLISNSTMHGRGYLEHCSEAVAGFLSDLGARTVLFVPWALADHGGYEAKAKAAFATVGLELLSVHRAEDPTAAVSDAGAVFVGGGNTFRLLDRLQQSGVADAIRERVFDGMPYLGSSAGTNVAGPTIRTTNDMPIVEPRSLVAIGLVPFQLNPHYLDPDPGSRHMGETREERLMQFHEENDTPVLGMREGAWLRIEGDACHLLGTTGGRLFRHGKQPEEIASGADLSFLMRP